METKKSKLIQRAEMLKSQGYLYLASKVKRYKYTDYYHVMDIDKILEAGKWISAPFVNKFNGPHYRQGVNGNHIDWTITATRY